MLKGRGLSSPGSREADERGPSRACAAEWQPNITWDLFLVQPSCHYSIRAGPRTPQKLPATRNISPPTAPEAWGSDTLTLTHRPGRRSTVKACASNRRDGTLSAPAVLLSDLLIFRWKNHREVAQKPEGSCQVRARERGSIGTEWGRPPPLAIARPRSELGDLECGSVQVENNRARSAGFSYRFGNLSWEGYREASQEQDPGVLEPDSLSFPAPLRQGFGGPAPGWRHAALMTSLRPSQTG